MLLFVGLGNPGPKYAGNRHNVGFMALDELASRWKAPSFRDKFQGELTRAEFGGDEIALLKPMTFMNLSGESVQKAMAFFKIPLKNVLVIHDELDLPFATNRIKVGGGAAGHNGLKSIIAHGGGPDFARIRIGISRPTRGDVADYVLADFSANERAELRDVLQSASLMAEAVVQKGAAPAMNEFNSRAEKAKPSKPAV